MNARGLNVSSTRSSIFVASLPLISGRLQQTDEAAGFHLYPSGMCCWICSPILAGRRMVCFESNAGGRNMGDDRYISRGH